MKTNFIKLYTYHASWGRALFSCCENAANTNFSILTSIIFLILCALRFFPTLQGLDVNEDVTTTVAAAKAVEPIYDILPI